MEVEEMTSEDKVLIFDTTLRDGEQSPGVALGTNEKLEIARALEKMRVDFIEAGFPASSPGDFESVTAIAKEERGTAIAGLARAVAGDGEAIEAGATTVNIPGTVGYAIPEEFAEFIRQIQEKVPNIHKAVISVHCHNDLGLAVGNSLAAVRAGAPQVEPCVNGIGERAGNASLEEVVMAIKTRSDFFDLTTNVDTTQIHRTSRLVSQLTGMSIQPNKAIVGANAFRHQSGIHQHGITKLRETYEIIDARDIGLSRGGMIVLNKNSGRHGLKSRLDELGYEITSDELDRVFVAFEDLADKKGEIDDRDLDALVSEERRTVEDVYKLHLLQVSCGNQLIPTATVRIIGPEGKIGETTSTGTGPVDAPYREINGLIGMPNQPGGYTW